MSLAFPLALAWAALAVPIVIFYILKIRLRQVPVSSTIFWRQIYDEKQPRSLWQVLRHLLSLLMQILLLLLLVLVPLAEPDICCGSAGIFNLVQPEMAATLGQRKAGHIADAGVDMVVTSNPGCILQIRAALRGSERAPQVIHIVELLDRSIRSG